MLVAVVANDLQVLEACDYGKREDFKTRHSAQFTGLDSLIVRDRRPLLARVSALTGAASISETVLTTDRRLPEPLRLPECRPCLWQLRHRGLAPPLCPGGHTPKPGNQIE